MRFGICSSCNQYNYLEEGTCPSCSESASSCSGNIIAHRCDECEDTLAMDCEDHDSPDTTELCVKTGDPKQDCSCDDGGNIETIKDATDALEDLRDSLD